MSAKAQSRLLTQLMKEEARPAGQKPNQKKLEDLYQITCKHEPNNLKLVQFLVISLQKKLMTNAHGLKLFSQIYDEFSIKPIESDLNLTSNSSSINPDEEKKFHRQKFLKVWVELAKRTYPGDETAYQKFYYSRLVGNQIQQNRLKLDDSLKKLINKQNLRYLLGYEQCLQKVFTIYNPQNYNKKLNFSWNQLKLLNRKLPILCCFRFLVDAEVCPNVLSTNTFFELVSKYLPPSNNNHRETLFYNSETIHNYAREHLSSPKIKLLEGDIGLSFHQFQLVLMRISIQLSKELALKGDLLIPLRKLFTQIIGLSSKTDRHPNQRELNTEFTRLRLQHSEEEQKQKIQSSEDAKTFKDVSTEQQQLKLHDSDTQFADSNKNIRSISYIKRVLDQQTSKVPNLQVKTKQNDGIYDMNEKCIIIGQQPPKIVEKVRMAPKPNKKEVDELLGQKPQVPVHRVESHVYFKEILNPSNKPMKNNSFYPILLSQAVSSKDLSENAQLYVQTAFINLYEHNYQAAKEHLKKAKTLQKTISKENKIFFLYVEGQINEAMGEDETALQFYFKCLQIIQSSKDTIKQQLKALPYSGIGGCLYHAGEFQYALRCFLKAKQLKQSRLSKDNEQLADLLNNLGCCYLKLERAVQARKSFQQSYGILQDILGVYHERTLVVLQNLNKSKKCYVQRVPEYKSMWRTFTRKAGLPQPKKKK